MSQGRRIAYILMLCTIARHLMSNEYGPFDRLVELGVFLFVGYEVVMGIWYRRKAKIRGGLVAQRVAAMRDAMSRGQELQLCTPASGNPNVDEWAQAVSNWGEETRVLLKSFSAHAETAFLMQTPVSPFITSSIGALSEYISLISRLSNLRGIIEKPDVYF
jgi:hypothetical protein